MRLAGKRVPGARIKRYVNQKRIEEDNDGKKKGRKHTSSIEGPDHVDFACISANPRKNRYTRCSVKILFQNIDLKTLNKNDQNVT